MPKCDFYKVALQHKITLWYGVLIQICCTFSEHLFLRTPLEGCSISETYLKHIRNIFDVLFKISCMTLLKDCNFFLYEFFFFKKKEQHTISLMITR